MKKIILIIVVLIFCTSISTFSQIAVIANKSVNAGSIDISSLKNIYNLDLKNFGGTNIVLFDLKEDNQTKTKFYSTIGSSTSDIKKVWLKAKLTGSGTPPVSVSSDDDMLSKVASTSGAIGYIPVSKVTAQVKVLFEIK